jgi:hypothetical protein
MTASLSKTRALLTRLAVAWKVDCSSNKGMNCFGMLSRDAGHSRVPEPPHIITGRIKVFAEGTCSPFGLLIGGHRDANFVVNTVGGVPFVVNTVGGVPAP